MKYTARAADPSIIDFGGSEWITCDTSYGWAYRDGRALGFGSALADASMLFETTDANANALILALPDAWDRNTARATLDGEFPNHALFRYVQRVPSSTITHVSVSPPFHPARPDFSRQSGIGDHGISPSGLPHRAET